MGEVLNLLTTFFFFPFFLWDQKKSFYPQTWLWGEFSIILNLLETKFFPSFYLEHFIKESFSQLWTWTGCGVNGERGPLAPSSSPASEVASGGGQRIPGGEIEFILIIIFLG